MIGSVATNNGSRVLSLLESHYTLQKGAFFSEVQQTSLGFHASSKTAQIPMWNHSTWTGQGEKELGDFIEDTLQWHGARDHQPTLYLTSLQAAFADKVIEAGFDHFDREAWMVYEAAPPTIPSSEHLRLVRAQTKQEIEDFIAAFYSAYSIKEHAYAEMLERQFADPSSPHHHYLLYASKKPVSITTVSRVGEFSGIYNVGTPQQSRRLGYAEALLRLVIARILEEGPSTIFLQVESGGPAEQLYRKLGFTEIFTRTGYRFSKWVRKSRAVESLSTGLAPVFGLSTQEPLTREIIWRENKPIHTELSTLLEARSREFSLSIRELLLAAGAALLNRYVSSSEVNLPVVNNVGETLTVRQCCISGGQTLRDLALELKKTPWAETEASSDFAFHIFTAANTWVPGPASIQLAISESDPSTLHLIARVHTFNKDAVRRFATHYLTFLYDLLHHSSRSLAQVELLSPRERQQVTIEWNASSFESVPRTVQLLFEKQVEKTPEATALIFARNGIPVFAEEMTYRQLNRSANRLAHRLQKMGVLPETMVGVCLGRSLDLMVSLLAIFKARGACVPLDPAYPPDRISFMVQDTKAPIIITTTALAQTLPQTKARLICLDAETDSLSREIEKNPEGAGMGTEAAYVIYTSGSTGQPKGVIIPQEAIANHALDCQQHYGLSPKDRVLQFSSFNFDASFEQIIPALVSGSTLIVRDEEIWSVREFANKLVETGLTVADIPTAYWHQLVEEWHKDPVSIPNHSLRLMIVGGEALSPEKLALWNQTSLHKIRLINAYGPTETTITATSFTIPSFHGEAPVRTVPIGRPRGDRKVYILDQYGHPTPIGVAGELHIGGRMLARGYHNRPDLTQVKFINDPFSDAPDARLYKTGDLVRYLEDGNIEFLGRVDDQVKIRGFRIELGEVENALREHPSVSETMVLARAGEKGEKRLVAYLTTENAALDERTLRGFLKSRLPDYMIPSAFVLLRQWPLLANGKVDRRALPDPEESASTGEFKGPRDPLELQIQLIFERVLRRVPVGIDNNFFELGGDSLQALELIVEVEKATGKHLPLGTLYQSATIETLAREIRERAGMEEWQALAPMQISGKGVPLYFVHTTPGDILGYGNLVFRLGSNQPCYGLQSLGLKDASLSHSTIEQMAAYYVEEIRKAQPNGPYHLAGWCYGGVVAVEMARIMGQAGLEVGLLALLETVAMPPKNFNWRYQMHRLRCFFEMSPTRWAVYVREKIHYMRDSKMANRMRFRQIDGSNRVSPDGQILDPRLAQLEQVYNANLTALKKYRTEFYPGKITLFNAVERDPALIADQQYGWVGLAAELEIHTVPGNHDSMLTEPNVDALAEKITSCLKSFSQSSQVPSNSLLKGLSPHDAG